MSLNKVIAFPGSEDAALQAVASRITPLPKDVLPSAGFIVVTRRLLLGLRAAKSKVA